MKLTQLTSNIKTVYSKTTFLEGTMHIIIGSFKMLKVLILSAYWGYNFNKKGKNLTIFPKTIIDFPKNIIVGDNFSLNHTSHLRSENIEAKLIAGNNVAIGKHVALDYSGSIKLGSNICISDYAHIHTHDHGLSPKNEPTFKLLIIEDDVWLGDGSIILPKVSKIGKGSIVAARAVVTKDVPPFTVVAGNPAKVIKELK